LSQQSFSRRIEEEKIRSHVGEVVRQTVEETLNGLPQAEADELCGAKRYARSPERSGNRSLQRQGNR
jgi:transposase-like protein